MLHPNQCFLPLAFNRYIALLALKKLPANIRMTLDSDTYVIRTETHYIAYRTWMQSVPVIEIFYPNHEVELINWLEQFGYMFESERFQFWFAVRDQHNVHAEIKTSEVHISPATR